MKNELYKHIRKIPLCVAVRDVYWDIICILLRLHIRNRIKEEDINVFRDIFKSSLSEGLEAIEKYCNTVVVQDYRFALKRTVLLNKCKSLKRLLKSDKGYFLKTFYSAIPQSR